MVIVVERGHTSSLNSRLSGLGRTGLLARENRTEAAFAGNYIWKRGAGDVKSK